MRCRSPDSATRNIRKPFIAETHRIHDEGVAFPVADRMSIGGCVENFRGWMRTPVYIDSARPRDGLGEDTNELGILLNVNGSAAVHDKRHSQEDAPAYVMHSVLVLGRLTNRRSLRGQRRDRDIPAVVAKLPISGKVRWRGSGRAPAPAGIRLREAWYVENEKECDCNRNRPAHGRDALRHQFSS